MRRLSQTLGGWITGVLFVGGASAQDAPVPAMAPSPGPSPIPLKLMVSHISNGDGGVDPSGQRLDAALRPQVSPYNQLRVIQERQVSLDLDQIETFTLPDGRTARIQPIHLGDQGVLMAVDIEGSVRMDVRVRDDHLVVIGGGAYEDGKLVISVEPDYE